MHHELVTRIKHNHKTHNEYQTPRSIVPQEGKRQRLLITSTRVKEQKEKKKIIVKQLVLAESTLKPALPLFGVGVSRVAGLALDTAGGLWYSLWSSNGTSRGGIWDGFLEVVPRGCGGSVILGSSICES